MQKFSTGIFFLILRGRAVWLACRAHNPKVIGSNPILVTFIM